MTRIEIKILSNLRNDRRKLKGEEILHFPSKLKCCSGGWMPNKKNVKKRMLEGAFRWWISFQSYKVAWVLFSIRNFEENFAVDKLGNRLLKCAYIFTMVWKCKRCKIQYPIARRKLNSFWFPRNVSIFF